MANARQVSHLTHAKSRTHCTSAESMPPVRARAAACNCNACHSNLLPSIPRSMLIFVRWRHCTAAHRFPIRHCVKFYDDVTSSSVWRTIRLSHAAAATVTAKRLTLKVFYRLKNNWSHVVNHLTSKPKYDVWPQVLAVNSPQPGVRL